MRAWILISLPLVLLSSCMEKTGREADEQSRIIAHLEHYAECIYQEQDSLRIDGVLAYSTRDRFVGGKTINFMSYLVCREGIDPAELEIELGKFSEVADFVVTFDHYETWSHMYALIGLNRLKEHGLLERAVKPETLRVLKEKLDWRSFVDSTDLSLINKPTNYYNVAYGIAKYRELLGWEREEYSQRILEKLITHIKAYSGDQAYMDETQGEGRFDRYSMLIPAEICARLWRTGEEIPGFLLHMLRSSCDIVLLLANEEGRGISYGRSLGPYGDSAPLMILSIGAALDLLSPEEKALAHAYSMRIVRRYNQFWLDQDMQSVNLWEKGRRTDAYRNKNRILGENISTCMVILNSLEEWEYAGFTDIPDLDGESYTSALDSLPQFTYIPFILGSYERGLAIVRQGGHVFMLPLISGGRTYFDNTPYLPVPTEQLTLETPPDTRYSHLLPRIHMKDGRVLMPLAFFRKIEQEQADSTFTLRIHMDELCLVGGEYPLPDSSFRCTTTYRFFPGSIERRDEIVTRDGKAGSNIEAIHMELLTFSGDPHATGEGIHFSEGKVRKFQLSGLPLASIEELGADPEFYTPDGALRHQLTWRAQTPPAADTLRIGWRLDYD